MFALSNGCQESCTTITTKVSLMNLFGKHCVKILSSLRVMNWHRFLLLALTIILNNISSQSQEMTILQTRSHHHRQERPCLLSLCLHCPSLLLSVQVPSPWLFSVFFGEGKRDLQSQDSRTTLQLLYWIINSTHTWCLQGSMLTTLIPINFINLIPYSIITHLLFIMIRLDSKSMI